MIKNYYTKKILKFFTFLFLFAPTVIFAHQPRITEGRQTIVTEPEISKAYYGQLTGEPDVYIIKSEKAFDLYVNILVPDISGQNKDVSFNVFKNGNQIAMVDGVSSEWKQFYEPFGADTYWMGPEYRTRADQGTYEIRVSSINNDSKYSLAIGEIEAFDGKEGMNALKLIPKLKKDFFGGSSIGFIASPFGWGLIVIMYLLAFVVGFIIKTILRKLAKNSPHGLAKNIGKKDRLIRLGAGLVLLVIAITTSWNPILIFISGFCVFQAVFSWCGFYAMLGKNTCPVA